MVRARFALLVPLALLVPAACADDDDPPGRAGSASEAEERDTTTTTEPTTTTAGDGPSSSPRGAPTSTTTPAADAIALTGDGGTGSFAYDLVVERSELCYRLQVEPAATEARIVRATGDPVVELAGAGNRCVATDAVTLEEIGTTPSDFAVEVSTAEGTLRATLR